MLKRSHIIELQEQALFTWYQDRPGSVDPGKDLESLLLAQHFCNFTLWGLEDEARRRDVEDSYIAKIKRSIDSWNQKRNDLIEKIDRVLLGQFSEVNTSAAELHSETAGMMLDRLSILSLKIRNLSEYASSLEEAELVSSCKNKVEVLRIQREDLAMCLENLLREFALGKRYFKSYRQFKAYNDPKLNPAVRNS